MNELATNFTHNYTVLRVGSIQSPCQHRADMPVCPWG